ncbi:MAG TPA: amidohydrolase family protein, partial [Pyrinomonadaceae bacterium]|nr:amidohydrolase family protein [Pyrinomonadaceae bacterium]
MKIQILRFTFALLAIFSLSFIVEAQSRTDVYAITNARIVTVSGRTLERGTIVVRNGLIEAVGETVRVPADARTIDGTGMTVYPGFFDAMTNLGMAAPAAPRPPGQQAAQTTQTQQQPSAQSNSNYPDGLRPEETAQEQLRAGEAQFETQRNAGFTTALTVPRGGVLQGQSAVINLAGDSASGMIIRAPFAQHVTFTTLGGGTYPTSLLGTFSALRQMLLDAQRLQEYRKVFAANPRGVRRPEADASLEALLPVLNRAMPIVFNANAEREIIRALDLAQEFNLRAIIAGGTEAWKVADRLKKQDVPVLLSLDFPRRTTIASPEADPEPLQVLRLRAEAPQNAARLAQAGVKFAFQSGQMRNITDFLPNAGKAIESGLSREAAIRAMTLSPAEIFGVENQLGSIETGKIANLVVSKGDVFAKDKQLTHVFVDGRLFEPRREERRPTTPGTTTPGATQPGAAANVGGNYDITIEIPGQPTQGTLILTQQGNILTGSLQTQYGTANIREGKISPDGFTFLSTVDFAGRTLDITVNGTVT